ncbi:MAG: hypothetical protein WAM66_12715 [Acidobacteriaceae bacterium]
MSKSAWGLHWKAGDMGSHYSVRDLFRQMPNPLLARFFEAHGALAQLDFATMKETQPKELFSAWLELPEIQRKAMDAELSEIHAISCEKGWCAIRDEAEWHLGETPELFAEFMEKLSGLASHSARAMVTFLDHREYWQGATLFYHADTLSYWRKRKGLPHQPASVHDDGRKALADGIRNYFHRTEGRGKNCVVDTFRRGELDYFFAYPEDYSQQSVEWVNGEFGRRPHNPAFEVIYVYSEKDGTLDLNCRGAHKADEPLQGMFAAAILGLPELPPDPDDTRIYDLNPLREHGFQFDYDPDSGIEGVAVKKLRLSSKFVKGDRITLEADAATRREAIYDLLDKVGRSVPLNFYNVTLVELAVKVATRPGEKAKSVTVRITYPNSCSLKYDDVDLRLRDMLVASGIEPREPTESMELANAETAEA